MWIEARRLMVGAAIACGVAGLACSPALAAKKKLKVTGKVTSTKVSQISGTETVKLVFFENGKRAGKSTMRCSDQGISLDQCLGKATITGLGGKASLEVSWTLSGIGTKHVKSGAGTGFLTRGKKQVGSVKVASKASFGPAGSRFSMTITRS